MSLKQNGSPKAASARRLTPQRLHPLGQGREGSQGHWAAFLELSVLCSRERLSHIESVKWCLPMAMCLRTQAGEGWALTGCGKGEDGSDVSQGSGSRGQVLLAQEWYMDNSLCTNSCPWAYVGKHSVLGLVGKERLIVTV